VTCTRTTPLFHPLLSLHRGSHPNLRLYRWMPCNPNRLSPIRRCALCRCRGRVLGKSRLPPLECPPIGYYIPQLWRLTRFPALWEEGTTSCVRYSGGLRLGLCQIRHCTHGLLHPCPPIYFRASPIILSSFLFPLSSFRTSNSYVYLSPCPNEASAVQGSDIVCFFTFTLLIYLSPTYLLTTPTAAHTPPIGFPPGVQPRR
jgi:hypothetical protein